ncbi:MAG: class I SAM-dependent methyltransferase [Actinomycetota bacterium]|nr:class I SAM-dependent methyltransferase [Actinomycetota bacterium]
MPPRSRAKTHDKVGPEVYEASRSGHFEDRRIALVDDALRRLRASTVVEVGSGTGKITSRLAAAHPSTTFFGVDIDPRLSAFARHNHAAQNVSWSAELPAVTADLVFGIDVIHHLHDRPKVFATIATITRPGGTWVVIEPNIWHPAMAFAQERMRRAGLDEDHFRPWQVEPEFDRAGFDVERRSYAHLWPAAFRRPPAWARRAERHLERAVGASVVYRLRRRAGDVGETI